jgi:hypothetical protein
MVFPSTTRNHDFSEGLIWLKCSHWLEGMSILTKGKGHERHMVLLVDFFTKCHVVHLIQKDKGHQNHHGLFK